MLASSSTGSSAEEARDTGGLHNSFPSDREHEGAVCVAGWVYGDGGKCLGCLGAVAADSEEAWRSSIGNIAKFTPKKYKMYYKYIYIILYI